MYWNKEEKDLLDDQFEKSFMLSFFIHVLGDIHQPLHSCSLFSDEFPNGDQGGNLFNITYKNMKELHAFYDSGAGQLPDGLTLVITINL